MRKLLVLLVLAVIAVPDVAGPLGLRVDTEHGDPRS